MENFIIKANQKHNNIFDYSKVIYKNCDSPVTIICKKHGEFKQTPYKHLNSKFACKICVKNNKSKIMSNVDFINKVSKIHNNKYEYSKTVYTGTFEPIIITCPFHGDFNQIASYHISGNGCKNCFIDNIKKTHKLKLSQEEFIKKASEKHNNKYTYNNTIYTNINNKIIITCSIHGDFIQIAHKHLQGNGCKECGLISSITKNSYKKKEYIFPSGKTIKLQGYENFAIDTLLKNNILEEDIITLNDKEHPKIKYFIKNKSYIYFPDIFIKSQNKIIEVKSIYTYINKIDINEIKKEECIRQGYNFEFWILDHKTKKWINEDSREIKLFYENYMRF
jgi:hypothetical protein